MRTSHSSSDAYIARNIIINCDKINIYNLYYSDEIHAILDEQNLLLGGNIVGKKKKKLIRAFMCTNIGDIYPSIT